MLGWLRHPWAPLLTANGEGARPHIFSKTCSHAPRHPLLGSGSPQAPDPSAHLPPPVDTSSQEAEEGKEWGLRVVLEPCHLHHASPTCAVTVCPSQHTPGREEGEKGEAPEPPFASPQTEPGLGVVDTRLQALAEVFGCLWVIFPGRGGIRGKGGTRDA